MPVVIAPAAVIAGLGALLFMLAWAVWGSSITRTLNVNLPIIGNALGNLVADALSASYQVLVGLFDGLIQPLAQFVLGPIIAVENTVTGIYDNGVYLYNALYNLITNHLPAALLLATRQAEVYTNGFVDQLIDDIHAAENAATATSGQVLADAEHFYNVGIAFTQSALATAESYAAQLAVDTRAIVAADVATLNTAVVNGLNQAEVYTNLAYNAATSYATGLATKAEQDIAAALATAEAFAQTTATATLGVIATDIDNTITTSLTAIWPDISAVIPELEGVIGTGDADILDALKRIDWTIPGTLAGVASLAGVTALTLARYLKDCGVPNCQNLSQFGQDLQAALAVVDDAAFAEFLVELIHNPSSAAAIIADTVGDTLTDAVSAGRSLISI